MKKSTKNLLILGIAGVAAYFIVIKPRIDAGKNALTGTAEAAGEFYGAAGGGTDANNNGIFGFGNIFDIVSDWAYRAGQQAGQTLFYPQPNQTTTAQTSQPKTSNSNIPVAAPVFPKTYTFEPRFGGGSVLTSGGSYFNSSGVKIAAPIGTSANPAKITALQLAQQTIGGGTKAKPKVVNLFDFASRAGGFKVVG